MLSCFQLLILLSYITNLKCTEYRLPTTILPYQYNIILHPNFTDPNNFTFSGDEVILLNVSADHFNLSSVNQPDSDPFIIQSNTGPDMKIINVSLSIEGSNSNIQATQSYNTDTQIMSFTFDITNNEMLDMIFSGSHNGSYILAAINIQFTGPIRDDMKGFYISQYEV